MPNPDDLVLCAGTLLQATFLEKVRAAAAGGFRAITLWPQDYARARESGRSDAELRAMVVRRAEDHDIELKPEQVSVQRTGTGDREVIHLAVDYSARVHLLTYSFTLHFTPTSSR